MLPGSSTSRLRRRGSSWTRPLARCARRPPASPPASRGRGVGRALVAAKEAEAWRRGLARVMLGARLALPANRVFFAACGYREAGFETHAGYGAPTSVRMERML